MGKLRVVALLCVATTALGMSCGPGQLEEHVLDRMGYGIDSWSFERLRKLGFQRYIDEQLHPERIDDGLLEADLANRYPSLAMDLGTLRNIYSHYVSDPTMGPTRPREDLSQAKVLRAVRSHRQLEQVLVDFWMNHFNVDGRNEIARWGIVTYERDAIRPHVFGHFRDMLRATAGHAAMLQYLDNYQNFRPGFVRQDHSYGPNENYAREILELHTVGVDAGYTLQDIQAVARAFTGWTTPWVTTYGDEGFEYLHDGHDLGPKQLMNELSIPAGGDMSDGEAVIDFLANQPATAQHIARKLCQRFVAEDPPYPLVISVAQTFHDTGGDLRETMRTLLLSSDFLSTRYARAKTKRPLHYVASLARRAGVEDEDAFARQAVSDLRLMGEDLYAAAPPTGYPEQSIEWSGEGAFLTRVNLAAAAGQRRFGFGPAKVPVGDTSLAWVTDLERKLRLRGVDDATRARVVEMAEQLRLAGTARAVQVEQATGLLLVNPRFLTH